MNNKITPNVDVDNDVIIRNLTSFELFSCCFYTHMYWSALFFQVCVCECEFCLSTRYEMSCRGNEWRLYFMHTAHNLSSTCISTIHNIFLQKSSQRQSMLLCCVAKLVYTICFLATVLFFYTHRIGECSVWDVCCSRLYANLSQYKYPRVNSQYPRLFHIFIRFLLLWSSYLDGLPCINQGISFLRFRCSTDWFAFFSSAPFALHRTIRFVSHRYIPRLYSDEALFMYY